MEKGISSKQPNFNFMELKIISKHKVSRKKKTKMRAAINETETQKIF